MGPALVAMVIASGIAAIELITSKYPHTYFVLTLRKCWALYAYSLVYGVIALVATLGLSSLEGANLYQLKGIGLSNPWVRSVAVALTIKAILHIRLFTATVGTASFPVGVETLVQIFEPWLLRMRTIDIDAFTALRDFLAPRERKYPDITDVLERIRENIPSTLPQEERVAFLADLDTQDRVIVVMERYIRWLGKSNFNRVFPP